MANSKIAVFERAGQPLTIEECPLPDLKEGEILVKNEYTTLCRSDISTYLGKRVEKSPTILGHEIVGRIVAMGPGAPETDIAGNRLAEGDRITWAIYAANPRSEMSRRGIPQKSPDLFKYGHERITDDSNFHGGLSQYTILRRNTPLHLLNEDIPLGVASIINCAVATVAGSLRLAGRVEGSRVAIWGIGMLGVIACAMCRQLGAEEIIAIDINRERLAQAERFGATACLTPDTARDYLSADITIDYSGNIGCMEATVKALAIGGTAVWVGGVCPQDPVKIDSEMVVRRLATIRGLHNYNGEDFRNAVEFITRHHRDYPFAELIYDGFTLDGVNEAFDFAVNRNPYRVGVNLA